jgi:chromosome partitioning protein
MDRAFRIGFVGQKGGTGKTTSCVNVGAGLAEEGQRVLLVDLDPQQGLTRYVLGAKAAKALSIEESVRPAITGDVPLEGLIRHTKSGLDVVPGHKAVSTIAVEVTAYAEQRLGLALARLDQSLPRTNGGYDYVLLDCPPSLDLLPLNAMHAADGLVLLVTPEVLPAMTLPAVMETVRQVRTLGDRADLRILGVLPCMARKRTNLSKNVAAVLPTLAPGVEVLPTVYEAVKVAEAPLAGLSVLSYVPRHQASEAYRAVTRRLVALTNGGDNGRQ